MLTPTSTRLLRFLLSLVIRLSRLRLSAGRAALVLRRWSVSLWGSILSFACRSRHSRVRLHANDAPMVGGDSIAEYSQDANVEEAREHGATSLATTPVWPNASWQDELSRLRVLTSSRFLELLDPRPSTPEGCSQRYKPRTVSQVPDAQLEIPAGQKKLLLSLPPLPDGWRRHVHPEGVVLFYHEKLRIFTESNICDHEKEEEIIFCATKLINKASQTDDVTLDGLTEIVLNVDDSRRWHYYFVDHTSRLLFWVDTVNAKELAIDMQGISDYNHIKYMVEAYYWYASPTNPLGVILYIYDMELRSHCEYYPHNRTLPRKVFEDLRGILNYARIDIITTDSSSSPFGQDELVAMLDLVNSLGDDKEISDPYSIWAIARLMAYFTENQFLNFCGQPFARLNADTPLFGKQDWNRRPLFQTINLFLLGSPNEHALRLQRVWVDGIIIQPRWKDFINRLTTELGRYTIFSTVMLAVNFSFLAVPGVVTPGSTAGPIEIIIYCSVVSTVASIIFSFGLLNVYSNPQLLIARNALEAIWTLSQTKTGMAFLAITHSLPIASLIWSIALFAAALAVQIFRPGESATVTTLSIEFAIIVAFAAMGVRVMRLFAQNDDEYGVEASTERIPPSPVSGRDIEQGSES